MGGKNNSTSLVAAILLIAVNLFAMVLCLSVFALAVWTILAPKSFAFVIESIGNTTFKTLLRPEAVPVESIVGLALLAVFLFFVAFMGLYGAVARSPFLLFIYSMLILLLLLLECSLFYYFSSNLVERGLQNSDGQWSHALRLAFQCCDKNITDLMKNQESLPWSCCGADGYQNNCTSTQVSTKMCSQEISNWLYKYQTAIYTSLAALHIVLSSCSLLRRSRMQPSLPHR